MLFIYSLEVYECTAQMGLKREVCLTPIEVCQSCLSLVVGILFSNENIDK
jgi:hypothetical protein